MFGKIRTRLKEKRSKERVVETGDNENFLREYLKNELAGLEELLSEAGKLEEMAEEKRRQIEKLIEQLEGKMFFFTEELEKIRLRFRDVFGNGDIKGERVDKGQIESQETGGGRRANHVEEQEENTIGSQQEDWELRLQSKEEENNLLKRQITEMEKQLQIERERKDGEIQGLKKRLEEMLGGQELL